jgi:serine protease Do
MNALHRRRRKLLKLFVSICCATSIVSFEARAASPLSISKVYSEVGGWTIGSNEPSGGCLGAVSYRDGTTVWVGVDSGGEGILGFSNAAWRSIENGRTYRIEMRAYGRRNWFGNFSGVERTDEKGLITAGVKVDFLADFARAGAISISVDGKPVTQLSLRGSGAALDAVVACKEAVAPPSGAARVKGHQTPDQSNPDREISGTGFFVTSMGHVLTNNHVIKDCTKIWAAAPGEPRQTANLIARDEKNDLAILKTGIKPELVPAFNNRPKIGEDIYVYGFPLSGLLATSGNFTVGNITATAGLEDDSSMLQISAPVQPGNSGGPVMDKAGNIAGVTVSKLNALQIAKVTDDVPQNVNFAIKAAIAENFLETNNITPNSALSDKQLETTSLADLSRRFTVRVTCQ